MSRLNFIAKRLLVLLPLLAGIILVVFLLAKVMPGDPARLAVGLRASPGQVAQARVAMGLDKLIVERSNMIIDNMEPIQKLKQTA